MYYYFNGTKIFYKWYGEPSNNATILLHGWGRTHEDFKSFVEKFSKRSFLAIDFPPFGESDKDIEGWSIFTYAQMVISLCDHLKITSIDIVGHSFGGRIALILCAVNRAYVKSCILVDSAGIKPKRNINYRINVLKYKLYKRLGKDLSNFGSKDYRALSPALRKVFVNIVQTNLDEYAKTIMTKTLIIWGENDNDTPLYMAKRLHKYIPKSKLEILSNAGHFSFLDCPLSFYSTVKQFWEEKQ